ncbi:MAG: tetratricopeptide repeat protein [Opitutaceae bacterium]|nr:tetratricopeptide repeat protein [Opitutaceae bacterium]
MSVRFDRAALLLQQGRHSEAESELRLLLGEQPEHALALAYLALAVSAQSRTAEALTIAEQGVRAAPDFDFVHYVRAHVLHRCDRDKDALEAMDNVIRLNPNDARNFTLLASIHLSLRDWQNALLAAEQALAVDPEHVPAANLRAMALVRLGRREEASQTVQFALERDPEDALSHANQGWNELHKSRPREAQVHFREALRLDPTLEYARQGMLEALRARNLVYRLLLRYFLWMGRQSRRLQWAVVLVTFALFQFAHLFADQHPRAAPYVWPLLIAFYLFVYLSWTAGPMFNLLLRLDRFGRLILTRDERQATHYFGLCLLIALGGIAVALTLFWDLGWLTALAGAVLSMAVAVTFTRDGRQRLWFALGTVLLAVLGLGGLALVLVGIGVGVTFFQYFLIGFLLLQIAGNVVPR